MRQAETCLHFTYANGPDHHKRLHVTVRHRSPALSATEDVPCWKNRDTVSARRQVNGMASAAAGAVTEVFAGGV